MKIDHLHQIRSIEKPATVRTKPRTGVPRCRHQVSGDAWPKRMPGIAALTDALSSSAEDDRILRPHAANLPTAEGSVLHMFKSTTLKGHNIHNTYNNHNTHNAPRVAERTLSVIARNSI